MYQTASIEPAWLELFPADRRAKTKAVRAQFAPISRAALRAAVRAQREARDDGADDDAAFDVYATELIRLGLRGWDEIADATGKALAFELPTKENPLPPGIATFIADEGLFGRAVSLYVTPYVIRAAEKNGLSLSRNGTSAGAKSTARAAKAPAQSARTRSAAPSRRKASASGT